MKYTVLALSLVASAQAHSIFQQFWVGTTDKNVSCSRVPRSNTPVTNVNGADIACNQALASAASTCEIAAGSEGTVEMHAQPGDRACRNEAMGGNHYGPIMVYMAKVANASTANGAQSNWFKVYEDGYDGKQWAVQRMNANCGKVPFTVPKSIASGDYLVRAEAIALHSAGSSGGAQFYMTCYQVTVTGGGSATPATVKLPGAYKASDPGILVNIHMNLKTYTIPGPRPFVG